MRKANERRTRNARNIFNVHRTNVDNGDMVFNNSSLGVVNEQR